ncbi:SusD/RagB family nutrient-binding outer membrane lipoprotein [Sphingobacterium corticibacterium]|uniref:SusD/RagB family nutrient-binding outer membrane lipoprotein n=1 Tax=Sphingobacterium corticibacterium TaxID=2484746 RepID=A0A4Q6XPH7_9SPHI|nr:SusD/RagB family nutrient-binding outer membrane lipoprotein [Sphingobacterium corticibacterium]RZF62143.1 SusD/RagB family nutrient-binding outer membrane lipoprotein [Sphingobacterium corticibacterium]
MKRIYYIIFSLVLSTLLPGCTKNFEEINTNDTKYYDVDLNSVFPGTVYRTMDLIGELNIQGRLLTFSRYGVLTFHASPAQEIGDSFFNKFYIGIIRDLVTMEREYTGQEGFENRLAMVKTWKVYMYYMMASIYGGVPMSEAITDGTVGIRSYKFDTEEEMYRQMLELLKEAGSLYNVDNPALGDYLETDPVFGVGGIGRSDLAKWQKFTNTLRLNIALQAQNLSMDLAREHATDVMQDETNLISSITDIAKLQWGQDVDMSSSYYFRRFIKGQTSFDGGYPALNEYFALYLFSYSDPRIEKYAQKSNELMMNGIAKTPSNTPIFLFTDTLTRHHAEFCGNDINDREHYCPNHALHQMDGLNDQRLDSILVNYTMPYVPMPQESNGLATGWEWEFVPGREAQGIRYNDPLNRSSPYNSSFVQDDFMKEDASMVLLSWADACFLKAEAAILFGLPDAQKYYEEGIRASFEQYGLSAQVADYMEQNGVKWDTDGHGFSDRRLLYKADINGKGGAENHLEQIYKQRYIAGFFNCLEGWNLERRTRVLRFPPFFLNGQSSNAEGYDRTYNYWNERFIYPIAEENKNKDAYYQAIENLKMESPYFRADRWGDNIFTSLGFAKLNPDIGIADLLYGGNKRLKTSAQYFSKKYGKDYDEVLATAKQMTGEVSNREALKKAFHYEFRELWSTYLP